MKTTRNMLMVVMVMGLCVCGARAAMVLHSTMDDANVHRGATYPPPALSSTNGSFTIDDTAGTAENGTTSGPGQTEVQSSKTGKIGEAIDIVGYNGGYPVNYGNTNDHTAGQGYTVSIWINPSAINEARRIIDTGEARDSDGWSFNINRWNEAGGNSSRGPRIAAEDNGTVYALNWNGSHSADTWYNMVMVLDPNAVAGPGDTGRVIGYFNGVGSGTSGTDGNWNVNSPTNAYPSTVDFSQSSNMVLGQREEAPHTNEGYRNLLDDFAIWDEALTEGEARSLFTLADSTLNYNASQAQGLWDVLASGTPATIGSMEWSPTSGLSGNVGDVLDLGSGDFALVLDSNGNGVTTVSSSGPIPEPMTMLAVGMSFAGLGGYVRKRRRA